MKTEQLETVIVSAKAAQEHAEQELRQTQSELQSVQAELAGLKEEAETEKVRSACQLQVASQAHRILEHWRRIHMSESPVTTAVAVLLWIAMLQHLVDKFGSAYICAARDECYRDSISKDSG